MRFALLLPLVWSVGAASQPASARLGAPEAVDVLVLPAQDHDALVRRTEAARRAGPAPLRFAEPVAVGVRTGARGTWSALGDGTRVWRLGVSSPGAYSLSFGFSRFRLPEGGSLWIYPEGEAPTYRPFTADDNEAHGSLWTPIVPGDRAVIEVNLPPTKGGAEDFDLELGQVNHAFLPTLLSAEERARLGGDARQSGSCNVDVVCPQGDGFRDVIRSVGAYTVGGVDFCSGAAINNTSGDSRPLFLTADHCGLDEGNAAQVVVYWNYQNSTCRTPGSAASGAAGDGLRTQFNTGTVHLGGGAASDWTLLEFDDPILAAGQVFLAGWDRRDLAPASAVAVHHPGVEEKRISFENQPTSITAYSSGTPSPSGTHIRVADWDLGTTEGGSSGSPLFNADRRIVGQLHGGGAACGNDEPDWYGRLHHSMGDGLAAFLDPSGTGAQTLGGMEYVQRVFASADADVERARVGERVVYSFSVENPTGTAVPSVQFTNALPVGLTFAGSLTASTGTASVADGTVSWAGPLPAGQRLTISYAASVAASTPEGVLANEAAFDLGAAGTLRVIAPVMVVGTRPTPDLVVDATPALAIPDAGCPSFTEASLAVGDDIVVGRVSVGVGIEHTWRGDLRVRLTSPAGTTVDLINRVGPGSFGSSAQNLNVLVDDGGAAGIFASDDHDLNEPYDAVEGAPEAGQGTVGALSEFIGQRSQGTWRLGVCDGAAQDTGTLQRWQLLLVEAAPVSVGSAPRTGTGLSVSVVGPNPVRDHTAVEVETGVARGVRLDLLDAAGRTVRTLDDGWVVAVQRLPVAVGDLAAGLYFVRAASLEAVEIVPMVVVR